MNRRVVRVAGPLLDRCRRPAFWTLTHGGLSSSVQMNGFVEAIDHPLAPTSVGRLASLRVVLGQQVKAGDVVATLDARELELKRDGGAADLALAQAEQSAAKILQRAAVVRAELLVLRLRTQESKGRAELAQLRQQLARLDKLANQQLVQAQDVEARRLQQAGLTATVDVLSDAASKKLAGLGRQMKRGSTDAQVAVRMGPYREVVHVRELALKAAELSLSQATIKSPVDGVVSAVLHYPGDVLSAGTEVVRVTTGRPGHVVCWVPERLAPRGGAGRHRDGAWHRAVRARRRGSRGRGLAEIQRAAAIAPVAGRAGVGPPHGD